MQINAEFFRSNRWEYYLREREKRVTNIPNSTWRKWFSRYVVYGNHIAFRKEFRL